MKKKFAFLCFYLLFAWIPCLAGEIFPVTIKENDIEKIVILDNGSLLWLETIDRSYASTSTYSLTYNIHLWNPSMKMSNVKVSNRMVGYAYSWNGDIAYYDWGDRENLDLTKVVAYDKIVRWSTPMSSPSSTYMSFNEIATFASNVAIGANKTVAWSLSGTFDNSIKIIYSELFMNPKVDDPLKPGTLKNLEDKDIKRKIKANPSGMAVTDRDTVVWWTKHATDRSICILTRKAGKPTCISAIAEKVFFTKDETLVWFNKDVLGTHIKMVPGQFVTEPADAVEGTDNFTLNAQEINNNIKTLSTGFSDLKVTHSGHIIWWNNTKIGSDWIKILYASSNEPVTFNGSVKDLKVNSADTISWISDNDIKVLKFGEIEPIIINDKANYHAVSKGGVVAWAGYEFANYWVKVLFPGKAEPYLISQYVDGMAEFGTDRVIWWGKSNIDDAGNKAVITYFSMIGTDCYLPKPIAGENGCSKSGNFNKNVDLTGTTSPEDVPKGCFDSLRYKWETVSTPIKKNDSLTKPWLSGYGTNTSFTINMDNGVQGWYLFRFCVSGDGSVSICDQTGVKMLAENAAPESVPCRQDTAKLFSCSLNPEGKASDQKLFFLLNSLFLLFFFAGARFGSSIKAKRLAGLLVLFFVLFSLLTACGLNTPPSTFDKTGAPLLAKGKLDWFSFDGQYEVTLGLGIDYTGRQYYFYFPAVLKPHIIGENFFLDLEIYINNKGKPEIRTISRVPMVDRKFSFTLEDFTIPKENTTLLTADSTADIKIDATLTGEGKFEGTARLDFNDAFTLSGKLSGFLDANFLATKNENLKYQIESIKRFY